MKTDYCIYPPKIAADVEVSEQREDGRTVHIAGSMAAGRFILMREAERNVLGLLDGALTPAEVCAEFRRRHGAKLSPATLTKFLAKLDEVGILAGTRVRPPALPDLMPAMPFYLRFSLFNPDRLFTRMAPYLRWMWTPGSVVFSLLLMFVALLLSLMNPMEMASYGIYTVREHYLALFIVGMLVGFSHEFAHGLTCKVFGGPVTEVGALLIYYFIPGLYCNVSGMRLIPQRSRRLWVIAAGVYWQVLVGVIGLLAWFLFAPYTLMADVAFIFFLSSVVDVVFNANPLIKLDGYYFLSQWLRLPNLMDRSRAYWRGILKRALFGVRNREAARWSGRERAIYFAFGLLSFVYTVGLRIFIVCFAGAYFIDWFHFSGLLLTAGLALFYARRPLRQVFSAMAGTFFRKRLEGIMAESDQKTSVTTDEAVNSNRMTGEDAATPGIWRRRLVPLTVCLLVIAALLIPWNASIGAYGTLIAIPGQEAIIRAPESATLIALRVQPGEQVAGGAAIGQMGAPELEDQIAQAQTELARAAADYDRLSGELRARSESSARAELQLGQRQREFNEISFEQQQINARLRAETQTETREEAAKFIPASAKPAALFASDNQPDRAAARYPAAIAALQSEAELRRARFDEASLQLGRARQLYAQGIVPRSELDAAETRSATLAHELAAAHDRFNAALVEHRRRHAGTATEMNLARSDLGAAALQTATLEGEIRSLRALIGALENRLELLRRRQAQFALVTPRAGAVFGEDLPRLVGHYFQKGAEICRVAETQQLLLRIQVPEREISDVRAGSTVRLRTRAFPDRAFHGVVTKIGGESEPDQQDQATYRVELTIDNADGALRPGMTAFARIEFGRRMIGGILAHKIKRALRPELWML